MKIESNGHFPVNRLDSAVLELFNRLTESETQVLFEKGLKKQIKLTYSDGPIKDIAKIDPRSNPDTLEKEYQIRLYDNFCQYFWCLCYSVVVAHEEFIGTSTEEGSSPDQNVEHELYKKKAYEHFRAGASLFNPEESDRASRATFFSLPMPNSKDDRYVNFVNNAYTAGINFILLHELKHFELGHRGKPNEEKQEETDADLGAYWHLILSESPKVHKRFYTLGVLLAQCSLTFIDDTMEGDESHPNPEVRIASILSCNEIPEQDREYCYAIICLCFKLWYFKYKNQNDFPLVEDAESWEKYWSQIVKYFKDKKKE